MFSKFLNLLERDGYLATKVLIFGQNPPYYIIKVVLVESFFDFV